MISKQKMSTPADGFFRPDVEEARGALERVKGVLVYKDEDELDTGMQKVQPLPYLDEEILKFKKQIESARDVAKSGNTADDVPEKVLSKVDHVIHVATEGKTTLFKASELLEFTMEPFQYARRSAQNDFDLSRKSHVALQSYDRSFTEMMEARLAADMERATACEEKCLEFLKSALEEAEVDYSQLEEHQNDENGQLERLGKLEEVKVEVKDSIADEIYELKMIKDQCVKDMQTIDSELVTFKKNIECTTQAYKRTENEKRTQLGKNRERQAELRAELADLEQKEAQLTHEIEMGESQEGLAKEERERAVSEVKKWKERVEELRKRSETSLSVMNEMSEVTTVILSDAQQKQQKCKEKLDKLARESLLAKRDGLMAEGVMYMIREGESRTNMLNAKKELEQLQKDRKIAARSGFQLKVKKINQDVENYEEVIKQYEVKEEEAKERLRSIREALKEVDKELTKIQPRLKLDRLEDRYSHRRSQMEQIFNNDSVEGVNFSSLGQY